MKRIFKERQAKLDDIKASGVDPYPYGYEVTHHSADVKESFEALSLFVIVGE